MSAKAWVQPPGTMQFRIEPAKGTGGLPAKALARVFDGLQDILYLMGEEVLGVKSRAKGKPPAVLREKFELRVTKVSQGSVVADFTLPVDAPDLHGDFPFAKEAIQRTGLLFGLLAEPSPTQKALQPIIKDPLRRRRALEEMEGLVSAEDAYIIEGRLAGKMYTLDRHVRTSAIQLRIAEPLAADRVAFGRIHTLSVDKKREFRLEVADAAVPLIVRYPRTAEEALRKAFGRLAEVRLKKATKGLYRIESQDAIARMSAFPITEFLTDERPIQFAPPLLFDFQVDENDHYTAYNEELDVLATGKNLFSLAGDAQGQLRELWEIYVDCPEEDLTADALELRSKFLRLVGREAR